MFYFGDESRERKESRAYSLISYAVASRLTNDVKAEISVLEYRTNEKEKVSKEVDGNPLLSYRVFFSHFFCFHFPARAFNSESTKNLKIVSAYSTFSRFYIGSIS